MKTFLALWLFLMGVAQGVIVYPTEPPLGNFFVKTSEAIQESPPETQNRNRDFDRFAYDCPPETAYCHNDPVNRVDVLGLSEVGIDWKGATDGYGLVYYHVIREPDGGARGGFFSRAWTWFWNDGNIISPKPRAYFEKIIIGRISINDIGRDPSEVMVELGGCGGPGIAYSDLIQLGNRDSNTAKLNTPEERRLAVMCLLSRHLAKDNGGVGDHLVGVVDKVVSAPFQAIASILGIETSTILEAAHQKDHVTYFDVDSKSFTRGGWEGENILKQAELASYFIVAGQVYKLTQAGKLVFISPRTGGGGSHRLNIGGAGEAPGFIDVVTPSIPEIMVNGRAFTTAFKSGSASDIFLRNAPMTPEIASEIVRLSTSGTRITTLGPVNPAYIKPLTDALGSRGKIIMNRVFTAKHLKGGDVGYQTSMAGQECHIIKILVE